MSEAGGGRCTRSPLSSRADDLTPPLQTGLAAVLCRIVKDYGRAGCRRKPQQSSITAVVKSHKWAVSYAPAPSDIIWFVPTQRAPS